MNTVMDAPKRDQSTQAQVETYSIVVAEDDRKMADLVATTISQLGHRVAGIAWNGKEAVAVTLKTRPDVVLMDIQMPILDGLQAARAILSLYSVPIVFSTALSDARIVLGAVDLNLLSYLVKPFSPAQLNVCLCLAVAQCRGLASLTNVSASLSPKVMSS